jgi:hypothetical protein
MILVWRAWQGLTLYTTGVLLGQDLSARAAAAMLFVERSR